jgi:hypothetical protein
MPRNQSRGDGLRIKLSAIPGVTRGDAKKVLKNPYYFQCPPLDELQRQWAFTFSSYTNYKGEEFLQRGGKQLTPITFRTVAVEWGRFTVEWDFDVDRLEKDLNRIVDAGWPVQMLMTHQYGKEAEFDAPIVIESFTSSENAGEQDARYFDLACRRWNDPITNRRGGAGREYPVTINLVEGGQWFETGSAKNKWGGNGKLTFSMIAQHYYGKPSLASYIHASQRPTMGRWGMHDDLFATRRRKIVVPEPPKTDQLTSR